MNEVEQTAKSSRTHKAPSLSVLIEPNGHHSGTEHLTSQHEGTNGSGCACPVSRDGQVSEVAEMPSAVAVVATFPGCRDQVRRVRAFTAQSLAGWPIADDVVLLTSELAANAVVHSASGRPGGVFWVHVTAVPDEFVLIEVCDQGGQWVRRGRDEERPHGLDIVRQLAAGFGVDGDDRRGRVVWARLDLRGREESAALQGSDGRAGAHEFAACRNSGAPGCRHGHASWPG